MTATISPVITEQQYLQLEAKATVRHEFINGKIYAMPGGMYPHEQVTGNIQFILKTQKLRANSQGLRVRLPETKDYYYPDVVVTTEKVTRVASIEKPVFIAEVLSPSTRTNDLTDKFIAYRQFPTLLYYLLVEPDFCYATLFYKTDEGIWDSEVYNQLSSVIPLPKLSASLRLVVFMRTSIGPKRINVKSVLSGINRTRIIHSKKLPEQPSSKPVILTLFQAPPSLH